jgi:pimeloyl-ACP methyl ester carboxylesterase
LQRIADEVGGRRIYALGVSMGGYAALYYGLQLGAEGVLNLAGATDFTPSFVESLEPVAPEYHGLRQVAPDYTVNLRDAYACATHRPHVIIAYSAGNPRDRQQAERMAGLPNVELVAVDYAQHNVLDPLIRNGEFLPLLQRLLSTEGTAALAS